MDVNFVFSDVLKRIKPSKAEQDSAFADAEVFLKQLKDNLSSKGIKAKAVLGGSFAKDTWLSGDYDVDIFVKFDLMHKDKSLSDLLESALFSWKFERVHGSRDYFWIYFGSVRFELVPVLDISKDSDAKNVTDFSPLHIDWTNKNGVGLKDDIRLCKQFCKANKVYGAESFIKGFSGHVVDILVIHFNGFLNFLKAASSWKTGKKIIIDHYDKYKGKTLFFLNKSKTDGPLVVVDPVQSERNASAALSLDKLKQFIKAAKMFLKNPSADFFIPKNIDISKLKADIILKAVPVEGREDVVGCKLLQVFDYLKEHIDEDFGISSADWFWDKKSPALFWFKLKNKSLPILAEHKGPPLSLKQSVDVFKKKYSETFENDDCIWAKVKRKHTSPNSLLDSLLKSKYVKERVSSIKIS